MSVLNISAYRFVTLPDARALRDRLAARAGALGLKGTILLAEEGINLFLAGRAADVRAFVAVLEADPRFAGLDPKESWSDEVPFGRLLVKVKREIIRMNRPMIRPDRASRAPSVAPATLAGWLDAGHDEAGRAVVLLDTRNAFEVDLGTFERALDWRIGSFGDFPQAVRAHAGDLAGKTVVSFCTGGIRCEKAALLLAEAGVTDVYQLEGGILRYFEETDGRHWRGDCFVFDARRTVRPDLTPGTPPAGDAPNGAFSLLSA